MTDRAWVEQAACRGESSRPFTDPEDDRDVSAALGTCRGCPVRRQCLTAALQHPPDVDVGIWGGTTEHDRDRIRSGTLTTEAALQPPRQSDSVRQAAPATPRQVRDVPRLPTPEVTVARTRTGEYASADGRITIFRIHGQPPWMLMIDRRPIARTRTVTEARRIAWTTIHSAAEQLVTVAARR
jgi:hypothetical protein